MAETPPLRQSEDGKALRAGPKGSAGERSIALFFVSLLAFTPPLLSIFSSERLLFGIPPLYLFIFSAWGLAIFLIARNRYDLTLPKDRRVRKARKDGTAAGKG